ncbi:MAG: PilZ domain-containing protein [Butyribacter sp.]|nr:PilZ domain-containing protein [bacterium]MDY3855149.1 PilZ domain-containing protein [Butyribacter sp.]
MLLEKIPLGKTLEIFVDREDYRYRLVSKVEDTNEKRVCVTAISSRSGKYFSFLPTDRVRVLYRDQETMWEWDNVTAGIAMLDKTPVHYFMIADKGKSFNRRNAYRVSVLEEVTLNYYSLPEEKEKHADKPLLPEDIDEMGEEKKEWIKEALTPHEVKGMVKDVSETGVGVYSDEEFAINDSIFFEIPCPYGNLAVQALVVRKTKNNSSSKRFENYYGCVLLQSDRKLIRYIFDLQREMLKKQKG